MINFCAYSVPNKKPEAEASGMFIILPIGRIPF